MKKVVLTFLKSRWRVGERGRGRLVEVAANLERVLAGLGAAIKPPPPQQQQQEE